MALRRSWVKEVPRAWVKVLKFYFIQIARFGRIHPDLPSGRLLASVESPSEGRATTLSLAGDFAKEFNTDYAELKAELHEALGEQNFNHILAGSFAVRVLQCIIVFSCGWQWGLLVGLLQFIVAPLSLTTSFIRLLTNITECVAHFILCGLAWLICVQLVGAQPWLPKLTIDARFMFLFFAVDLALNVFVHMQTSESFGLRRMATHFLYGTFNTKTYFVVVLGCLRGQEFDLLQMVLTSAMSFLVEKQGLLQAALQRLGWPCFQVCFYVEHRIGHMPVVYQHAHKMHHYLHDSTAFDAHIYGSGMNEEFFWILAETLPCLMAPAICSPYFLNYTTLYQSWANKGAHTRSADGVGLETSGCFDEDNFHADHHTLHRSNFGSSTGVLLDFYFGTQGPGTTGANGLSYSLAVDPKDASRILVSVKAAKGKNRAPRLLNGGTAEETEVSTAVVDLAGLKRISLEEVQARKSPSDGGVWVVLHGGVFDLTSFHKGHPGGAQVILQHAGTDATVTFREVGHSLRAKIMANSYLVGLLEGQEPTGFVTERVAQLASASIKPENCKGKAEVVDTLRIRKGLSG